MANKKQKEEQKGKWTQFWDMHSGGRQKEDYSQIYIEAPENEAKIIFYNRFGHNPSRVSCTCCGDDYSISEGDSLEQITGYQRGCDFAYFKNGKEVTENEAWKIGKGLLKGCESRYVERESPSKMSFNKFMSIEQYAKQKDVLIIYAKDINDEERKGHVPDQGYVWVD
jgi:hypothetical protein